MKKEYYDFYGVPYPEKVERPEREIVESKNSTRAILQAIYAVDPVTKLPNGDIMCYMSSTTPPELKQYVIDNLMIDVSSQALPKLPDGLDDDTVFALERKIDESLDSYCSRVNDYMTSQVNIRNMAIDNAKRQTVQPSE